MPDPAKDLEIKLRATGGDAAAKEVEKLEEALEGVAEASEQAAATTTGAGGVESMVPAWEKATDAASDAADAVEDAGRAIADTTEIEREAGRARDDLAQRTRQLGTTLGRFGGAIGMVGRTLSAMAGGPIGIAIAAFTAIVAVTRSVIRHLDEVKAAAERSLPELARTAQRAAVEASDLEMQTSAAADAARDAETAYDKFAKRLRAVADQQAAVTDAELGAELAAIDLDELNGHLTEAEAALARYNAKREAEARKAADEIAAIEQELNNRRQQNEIDRQKWLASQDPAFAANAALRLAQQQGAGGVAGLDAEQEARRRAIEARAQATTTDAAELDALDAAVVESQEALAKAYDEMIANLIKEREKAAAEVIAKRDTLLAGQADAAALERELDGQTTGAGAQVRAAKEREAALRFEADETRRQMAADAAQKAEADRLAREQAQAARDAEARAAAAEAARLGRNAGASGQVDPGLVSALDNAGQKLADGTGERELEQVLHRLVGAMEGIPESQRSAIAPFLRRLETLEQQFRNNPTR
jgi:hypothetical protein